MIARAGVTRGALIPLALAGAAAIGCAPGARSSSPARPDTTIALSSLEAAVTVTADHLGIPTVRAASRKDAFRVLGYLTARDRLFQMDLLRRSRAGRLAEILGPDLLPADRLQRQYGMSRVASAILAKLEASQRAALDAYAEGVNGYLQHAATLPLEFQLLHYQPERWRAEDSVLVVLGMLQTLSTSEEQERTRTILTHSLPPSVVAFLLSGPDSYTKALLGTAGQATPSLPVDELRALAARADSRTARSANLLSAAAGEPPVGSNGWAVASSRTRDGRAILADDMHLELGVPNIWYRAELRYGDTALAGVLLPGVPVMIAGTNRHVAWGLTSLEGDVQDLVRLEVDPARPDEYRTKAGWRRFDVLPERIAVRGLPDVEITVRSTIWGPVASRPLLGSPVAIHWTTLDPDAVDLGLLEMDRTRTVDEAVAVMNTAAGPACNAIMADRAGRIAWTVTGRIPRRRGFDGAVSTSWADGRAGWDGYVPPAALPRIVDPATGFVVNANQRMPLGDGAPVLSHDYANGYRAYRITERLRAARPVTEADLFQIQLDTRSDFFGFYRDTALGALGRDATAASRPALAEVQRALQAWDGRAEVSSLGLAVLRRYRRVLAEEVLASWLTTCRAADPAFEMDLADIDTPLQRVLRERPDGVLTGPARDWDDLLVAALEKAAADVKAAHPGRPLDQLEWGAVSQVQIAHPLHSIPDLERLSMPVEPLAGCGFCVRMAAGTLAASERLVVSPGHEPDGILHMPAGQSGDPSSPHYRDQQRAWVDGRPLAFQAGPPIETLRFVPERRATSAAATHP